PGMWRDFVPTLWDWALYAGTLGAFATLMLLFFRLLPAIPIWELREQAHQQGLLGREDERDERRRSAARAARSTRDTRASWGVLATFGNAEALVAAARAAREAGFRRVEGYAPFPVHGLGEALGYGPSRLRWAVLAAGLLGAGGAFALQAWTAAVDYPWNV